jgi:hypothetical protein
MRSGKRGGRREGREESGEEERTSLRASQVDRASASLAYGFRRNVVN